MPDPTPTTERPIIMALLALWVLHLLAYVWLVPPWQHYDEPTHFEYAALIRDLGRLPGHDEVLPELRRAIATSMLETGFYTKRQPVLPLPDLDSPNLTLGINERGHPPLPYALAALATLPLRHAPIATQLYAARLCSVLLALVLFGAAYATLRLLICHDWGLRCLVLAALVFQPAFADNMSAMSNDACANLMAVLVLLLAAWFLRQPGWGRWLVGLAFLPLALNVKRTLIIFVLLLPLAWLLALPARRRRQLLLAGGAGFSAALLTLLLVPWPLADWKGTTSEQPGYIRRGWPDQRPTTNDQPLVTNDHSGSRALVVGRWSLVSQADQNSHGQVLLPYAGAAAFALANGIGPANTLSQSVYRLRVRELAGQRLTLAAWMRADRAGLRASTPVLQIDGRVISESLVLGDAWHMVTLTAMVPTGTREISVYLTGPHTAGTVLYDALALVAGGTDELPLPGEPDGSFEAGLLRPEAPRNLLRNAGAERHIPPLPSALRLLSGRLLDDEGGFRATLSKLFDPAWIAAAYPRQALLLFQSFWGAFGWGQISVSPGWYLPLGLLVLTSLLGVARITWRVSRSTGDEQKLWRARAWWLCLAAVALGWGAALLRVHNQPFPGVMFWSFGRYTYVALLPSLLIFMAGLRALLPPPLRAQGLAGVLGFLLIFALAALLGSVMPAYAAL